MFVCDECAKRALTREGRDFPWLRSGGHCELCDKAASCRDVPSNNDWPWKRKLRTEKK